MKRNGAEMIAALNYHSIIIFTGMMLLCGMGMRVFNCLAYKNGRQVCKNESLDKRYQYFNKINENRKPY